MTKKLVECPNCGGEGEIILDAMTCTDCKGKGRVSPKTAKLLRELEEQFYRDRETDGD